ncbi:tRNA 2'-phosphotransferase 1 [Anabrus simplex]|uniref:tRNA 2'-phosphotransferase 1 n=1 Tax=Anabrus simplex TaxID=316456 RepID=UPI0034DD59ED
MNRRPLSGRDKALSKTLSWLLRHGAVKEGLPISVDGYVEVSEILNHKSLRNRYTIEDIQRVVDENDKKRFTLTSCTETGRLKIKANQGHSIQAVSDDSLTPITHPTEVSAVIHGTYFKFWDKIRTEGLSRMSRLHIHFAPGEPGDNQVISGMRASCQIYIYINMEKALADGIPFYRSVNNVILSPGNDQGYIEPKYFSQVIQVSPRKVLSLN